jgi:sorting nexin-3/12
MMDESDATRRLNVKKQTLDDAYAVPANFLEIDVVNPMTSITAGKKRYTDYEVRMRVSIVFLFICYLETLKKI